ncbi:hypothetical protein NKDENANG_04080 [Candidatus Entotheonellaceae bacterium PAL068K]
MYYDPVIRYHHRRGPESALMWAVYLAPQDRDMAWRLFDTAAQGLGWTSLEPVREPRGNPRFTLWGLILAREFGNNAVYAKLKAHAETYYEPTWEAETGEFTWRFGLNETHPRGQLNATMMMAEALHPDAWWRLINDPNLCKFTDPTVYGVDFPTVCLSQAWYDVDRRRLAITTDAGLPNATGRPTSFRIGNLDPSSCHVAIDGQPSEAWRVVDGHLEITTTVGSHTVLITLHTG